MAPNCLVVQVSLSEGLFCLFSNFINTFCCSLLLDELGGFLQTPSASSSCGGEDWSLLAVQS